MEIALGERKFSVRETARELGVDPRTVANYINWGLLDAIRYSCRKQVVTQSQLQKFIERSAKRSKLEQLDLFDENFFAKDTKVA